jgi:DnaK suppressor protein
MDARRLKSYRERLRKRAEQLRHDAINVDEETRTPTGGQTGGGLSNVPMHLADLGTDLFHQELNTTLLENEQYLLNESLAALRRIDAGTYGVCEVCGVEIIEERLDALPDVRTCVKCSDQRSAGPHSNLNRGRASTEIETIAADEKLIKRRDLRHALEPGEGESAAPMWDMETPSAAHWNAGRAAVSSTQRKTKRKKIGRVPAAKEAPSGERPQANVRLPAKVRRIAAALRANPK